MSAITKKNIQEKIEIPSDLSEEQRIELGKRILVEVRDRTKRGIDKAGKTFAAYSKNYEKSGTPDLSSSGDMLASLDVLNISQSSITIGYEIGDQDSGQVQGIVTGEFGNPKPVAPRRDFIGIPKRVLNLIIAELRADPIFQEETEARESVVSSILNRFQ